MFQYRFGSSQVKWILICKIKYIIYKHPFNLQNHFRVLKYQQNLKIWYGLSSVPSLLKNKILTIAATNNAKEDTKVSYSCAMLMNFLQLAKDFI